MAARARRAPERPTRVVTLTAPQVLKIWESKPGAVEVKALDRLFPNEMLHIAERAIAEVRSGVSESELAVHMGEARRQLIIDNIWMASLAPDDLLKAYIVRQRVIISRLQQTDTAACVAAAAGGRSPSHDPEIAELAAAQISLIEAGRLHPVKHAQPTAEDVTALVASAKGHGLGANEASVLLTGDLRGLTPVERCRLAFGLAQGLEDLPDDQAGRLIASMLNGAAVGAQGATDADHVVAETWRKDTIIGPTMARFETAMPAEYNAMFAAMTERMKAGDYAGEQEAFRTGLGALLRQNMTAVAAAPEDKVRAVLQAVIAFYAERRSGDPTCGFDKAHPTPFSDAADADNRRVVRELIEVVLAGRQALAAGVKPASKEITAADWRDLIALMKKQPNGAPLAEAVDRGESKNLSFADQCSTRLLMLRTMENLPAATEWAFAVDYIKVTYAGGG